MPNVPPSVIKIGKRDDNNAGAIVNYGERCRCGERIRICRQPGGRQAILEEAADAMDAAWSPPASAGPSHVLDDVLCAAFRKWYPGFGDGARAELAA